MADEVGSRPVVIASESGDIGNTLFDIQRQIDLVRERRIDVIEKMNSSQFIGGVVRVSSALPSIGIVNFG